MWGWDMRNGACLVVGFIAAVSGTARCGEPVYFADSNLKAAVEESLGIADPNAIDVLELMELEAGKRGIVDLTGLEYATNLTHLALNENDVTNVSPISKLTNLTYLSLWKNGVGEASEFARERADSRHFSDFWSDQFDVAGVMQQSDSGCFSSLAAQ
jgi:hypothetical protein